MSAGITFEQVRAAYQQLKDQSIFPSVAKIRAILGTGSNSTIWNHFKTLREQDNAIEAINPEKHGALDPVQEDLMRRLGVHMYDKAEEKLVKDMTAVLEAEILKREKEIADMTQLIQELRAQLDTTQKINEKILDMLERTQKSNPELVSALDEIKQLRQSKAA